MSVDSDIPSLFENENAPKVEGAQLGWLETESGRIRYALWKAQDESTVRGTIVLAHGLSEQIEKYQPVVKVLLERNFAVAMIDWRGHGLSANWPAKQEGCFTICDQDLKQFIDEVVSKKMPTPMIGMAHSFGGCLMCSAIHDNPQWFAGGILCSPMLGISVLTKYPILVPIGQILSKLLPHGQFVSQARENRYTSDKERFQVHQQLLREFPQLRPKFHLLNWFNGAVKRFRIMRKKGWYSSITTPLLIFVAGQEQLVDNSVTRASADQMQHAQLIEVHDAWHEILMEQEHIRNKMWKHIDDFLNQIAPNSSASKTS